MNNNKPKTIQIYLPKGNPRGLRTAEMTTRMVKLIEIPRQYMGDFFVMPESKKVGVYFLIGESNKENKPLLYIGQTGDLRKRLEQHEKTKNSWEWQRAFVMFLTNNTLTQTHTLYMEHKAIALANEIGRYTLKNANNGNRPHTPEPLKADCEEWFDTLNILLSTLGQPIFDAHYIVEANQYQRKVAFPAMIKDDIEIQSKSDKKENTEKEQMIFYCQGISAQGYYNKNSFVILAGSLIRKKNFSSKSSWTAKKRDELIKEKTLIEYDDDFYKLVENISCKTPSGACDFVLGTSNNGWKTWKSAAGETLDSIYR